MSSIPIPNLRELRLKKGWSQDHLANVTSLSKRTIQRIESGTLASLETANSLVCALGLSGLHELNSEPEDVVTPLIEQNVATTPLMEKREPVVFENKPNEQHNADASVCSHCVFDCINCGGGKLASERVYALYEREKNA